ncbi:MAG TPA: septum formation initiator family protein [Gemmatimonadales bacterium]|nr:septum formation initiator family protein [Gemmatimonadales bacterium]
MTRARWLGIGLVLAGALFAWEGGEYSTGDYFELRRAVRDEADSVKAIGRAVDSLRVEAKAIEHDPKVQERVARERLGMIGKGEFVYRLPPGAQP